MLELSRAAEWGILRGLLVERLEYYNAKFLQSAEEKYRGSYYAILDVYNTLVGLIQRGQQVEHEAQKE